MRVFIVVPESFIRGFLRGDQVLNILAGYESLEEVRGFLGLHRLIEACKHMLAIRMNLGDPDFVDVADYVSAMISPSFAEQIRGKIFDDATFDQSYYLAE